MPSGSETSGAIVVLVTVPDAETARNLARQLVHERLAACVNIIPGITSIYRWEGAVEETGEVLLVMKTTADRYEALESAIRSRHPYDVPEILALPVG
jgi:periplasmic divalent cation tolerance protein